MLALVHGYAAALTLTVARMGNMPNPGSTPLTSPLHTPLNILLQWLATQPDYVRCGTVRWVLFYDTSPPINKLCSFCE